MKIALSSYLAAIGVGLLILASLSPADWYPAAPLFGGLALIAASHVLTPCQDQITKWWNARVSSLWRSRQ